MKTISPLIGAVVLAASLFFSPQRAHAGVINVQIDQIRNTVTFILQNGGPWDAVMQLKTMREVMQAIQQGAKPGAVIVIAGTSYVGSVTGVLGGVAGSLGRGATAILSNPWSYIVVVPVVVVGAWDWWSNGENIVSTVNNAGGLQVVMGWKQHPASLPNTSTYPVHVMCDQQRAGDWQTQCENTSLKNISDPSERARQVVRCIRATEAKCKLIVPAGAAPAVPVAANLEPFPVPVAIAPIAGPVPEALAAAAPAVVAAAADPASATQALAAPADAIAIGELPLSTLEFVWDGGTVSIDLLGTAATNCDLSAAESFLTLCDPVWQLAGEVEQGLLWDLDQAVLQCAELAGACASSSPVPL